MNRLELLALMEREKGEKPMTVGEAAVYYGLSTKTIRVLVKNNKIPGYKIGRQWRIFKKSGDDEENQETV